RRGLSAAGFKALWAQDGRRDPAAPANAAARSQYPSREFFRALNPVLENVVAEKLSTELLPPGSRAGALSAAGAGLTGLREGTPVAVGSIDAHAAVAACGVTIPGKLVMIL